MLESIESARIKGNRTTIAEYIETKIERGGGHHSSIVEIRNMEAAVEFIDEDVRKSPISRVFVAKLHRMVVAGLPGPPKGGIRKRTRTNFELRPGSSREMERRVARVVSNLPIPTTGKILRITKNLRPNRKS